MEEKKSEKDRLARGMKRSGKNMTEGRSWDEDRERRARKAEERKQARLEGEGRKGRRRNDRGVRSLEREGAWPWPLLRGNSVKVSADELPPTGGRRAGR